MSTSSHMQDSEAIQARLAMRLTAALSERAESVPHDISERLRVGREQALRRARESRVKAPVAAASSAIVMAGRGLVAWGGTPSWWQRTASVFPLIVLVAGLLAIEQWTMREQVLAAAEIDATLLSDTLPPAAYSDPGFGEFLRSPPP